MTASPPSLATYHASSVDEGDFMALLDQLVCSGYPSYPRSNDEYVRLDILGQSLKLGVFGVRQSRNPNRVGRTRRVFHSEVLVLAHRSY